MSVKEYVESFGYKVSDLTAKEVKMVEKELSDKEKGIEPMDGFFSPMSEFSQRMIQNS